MKMYYWSNIGVDFFQNYGSGKVVVLADSVDNAVKIAVTEFEKMLRKEYDYLFVAETMDNLENDDEEYVYNYFDDDLNRAQDCMDEFENWLRVNEPENVTCVLVEGSY